MDQWEWGHPFIVCASTSLGTHLDLAIDLDLFTLSSDLAYLSFFYSGPASILAECLETSQAFLS